MICILIIYWNNILDIWVNKIIIKINFTYFHLPFLNMTAKILSYGYGSHYVSIGYYYFHR